MTVTIFFRGNTPWFLNSLRPSCELSDRKLMLGIRWFTSTGEHDGPMWNLHGVYTMNRDEPYSCAEFWMIWYMVTWLNEAIWCYMMLYDIIRCYMMLYDVLFCLKERWSYETADGNWSSLEACAKTRLRWSGLPNMDSWSGAVDKWIG